MRHTDKVNGYTKQIQNFIHEEMLALAPNALVQLSPEQSKRFQRLQALYQQAETLRAYAYMQAWECDDAEARRAAEKAG